MSTLLDFFREKKDTFVKQVTTRENYIPCELSDGGTLYPSQWDEVIVEEFDWEAFEKAVVEFEESFQEGGENSWCNKLNGKNDMYDFKIGDKVEVIKGHPGLPTGVIHTVYDIYEKNGSTYVSLSVDGKKNGDGWDIDRFVKYEEKENTLKVELGKKYRMVGTHEPVRVICVDCKNPFFPCIALYTDGISEGILHLSPYGRSRNGDQIIEEVPEVDWSKVEVDTLIWVDGIPRYFASSSKYYVYFFQDGCTSKTNTQHTTWAHKSNCSLEEPKMTTFKTGGF